MKLTTLLNKHDELAPAGALAHNLGDGFLMENNKIFRQIRQKTLALGFKYSDQIKPEYVAFPMGQLETILSEKTIPYINNVTPLKNLAQRSPTIEWDHVVDNLKPNYVFHESCHALARSLSYHPTEIQEKVTLTLLEESLANTCEFFAIADAQDPTHRIFLEMNSYFTLFEDRTNLKNAIEKHGEVPVFKFMLLGYLHSNFLNDRFNEHDFKKIIELCDFKITPDIKALKALAQNALALNPRFRYATTEMYLRLNGIETSVKTAINFDPLKLIAMNKNLTHFVSHGLPY